ncbi:MAG: phosphoenolpyruvate synthase [Deltaproteobacteria bacterium]|jgi:pyruvate,water dikinase|nr:phosphoenolpyruvate synthase [Deltaproteobacteria bacterium]
MLRLLKKLISKNKIIQLENEKERFAARHYRFKLFLNAWNQLQEAMANMEAYLYESRPYSMQALQAICTNLSTQGLQCLRRLSELSGNANADLERSFERIQHAISNLLKEELAPLHGPLCLPLGHEELTPELCDPAMIRLAYLKADFTSDCVPPGYVFTAAACQMSLVHGGLQEELNRRIQAAGGMKPAHLHELCSTLRDCILQAPLPAAVEDALLDTVHYLREHTLLPRQRLLWRGRVWPSGGDMGGMSLWGPVLPLEGSTDEAILKAFKKVLAKKYDPEAVIYRFNRGLPDVGTNMCVGCFAVGRPLVGGVCYSRNPFNIPDTDVYLYAADSLPETVEHGGAAVDVYHVARGGSHAVKLHCPGMEYDAAQLLLTESQIYAVAGHAEDAELLFSAPQELEWFFEPDGTLRIVHVRPLRRLAAQSNVTMPDVSAQALTPLIWGGNTGCPGVACGLAYKVRNKEDARNFPENGIVIAEFDSVEWCALLDRAAGILCARGTAASRLAGMCRELAVPALFGLDKVMELVDQGREITLCAESGSVYPGRVEELLRMAHPRPNFISTSPLHERLKKIAQHVLPLTLTPDTPEFTAANCTTFHDIGRYCAERATDAMFRFGSHKDHSLNRVKQLMAEVAKQFWVINLDDAFPAEVKGAYIPLDDIACEGMKALWNGMNAKAWEGPPPMDSKGLLSVLFESTANPHIDPASQSTFFTEKNYFLVSRQYCSLHSRFGFHFVAVEIVAGKRKRENHAVFILRGGAADLARRVRRVEFVGSILQEFGFSVSIRNDSLRARAENFSLPRALRIARVAGYLVIHTLQLDMIMADAAQTRQRREQMLQDCHALFAQDASRRDSEPAQHSWE